MTSQSVTSALQHEIAPDRQGLVFKLLFLGEAGVGKTSLARRIVDNKFQTDVKTTSVVGFYSCVLDADVSRANVLIWDTTNKETTLYYECNYFYGADAIVLIYDSTNLSSFRKLPDWIQFVMRVRETFHSQIFIVGTKYDLEWKRQVLHHDLDDLLRKHRIPMFETSALTGSGVEETFMDIMVRVMRSTRMKPIRRVTIEQTHSAVSETSVEEDEAAKSSSSSAEDESTPSSSTTIVTQIQVSYLPLSNVAEKVEHTPTSTSAADNNGEQERDLLPTVIDTFAETSSAAREHEGQGKLSSNGDYDKQDEVRNLEQTSGEEKTLEPTTSSSICVTDAKAESSQSSKLEKNVEELGLSKYAEELVIPEETEAPKSSSAPTAEDQSSLSTSSSVSTVMHVTVAPPSNVAEEVELMPSSTSSPDKRIGLEKVSLSDVNNQLLESPIIVSEQEEQGKSSSNVKYNEEVEIVSSEQASEEGVKFEPSSSSSMFVTDTKPETLSSSKHKKNEMKPGVSKTASEICEEAALTSPLPSKVKNRPETGEKQPFKEKKEKERHVPEISRPKEKVESKPSVAARAARGKGSRSVRDPRKLAK